MKKKILMFLIIILLNFTGCFQKFPEIVTVEVEKIVETPCNHLTDIFYERVIEPAHFCNTNALVAIYCIKCNNIIKIEYKSSSDYLSHQEYFRYKENGKIYEECSGCGEKFEMSDNVEFSVNLDFKDFIFDMETTTIEIEPQGGSWEYSVSIVDLSTGKKLNYWTSLYKNFQSTWGYVLKLNTPYEITITDLNTKQQIKYFFNKTLEKR